MSRKAKPVVIPVKVHDDGVITVNPALLGAEWMDLLLVWEDGTPSYVLAWPTAFDSAGRFAESAA